MPTRNGEAADDDFIRDLRGSSRIGLTDEEIDGDSDAGDEEDEDQGAEGVGQEQGEDSTPPDPVQAKFDAFVDELVESIEKGDTNNKVYKGLQKAMSRKDITIDEQRRMLDEADRRLSEAEDFAEQMSEAMRWMQETLFDNLPESAAREAANKLLSAQNRFMQGRLQKASQTQRQPQPQKREEQAPSDADEQIRRYKQEFLDDRRAAVKRAGLNPDDPAIDYGDENEPLLARIRKFEASLDAAREKADEERRKKVSKQPPAASTRSGGGGIPRSQASDGRSNLDAGSDKRMQETLKRLGLR